MRLPCLGRDLACIKRKYFGADLQGAILDDANVDGALMTDCQGLTDDDMTALKARGAIFKDRLVDL